MATSPLFGWEEPDDTDLVKDGAAAIRTLGNAIDTSMGDLLGGTTGQILSKASNTNMDFTWVAPTTGDITGVTAGTGITGGGTSGDVTVSFDQANFGGGQFAAGKNKVINGDFGIWQRGTSFSTYGMTADRWGYGWGGGSGITGTITQQSFTAGTAPVTGYEKTYFLRHNITNTGGATSVEIETKLEDVRLMANQTVTLSAWLKADAARTFKFEIVQDFGSGGSTAVKTSGSTQTLTTGWVRYTQTISVPSISGKTIGTGSNLRARITIDPANYTVDIWGVQLEAGSTATPFQTASGTVQGELALCQRYYNKSYATPTNPATVTLAGIEGSYLGGTTVTANYVYDKIKLPVEMRTYPTVTIYSYNGATTKVTNIATQADQASNTGIALFIGTGNFGVYNASGGNLTGGNGGVMYHYTAEAEL